MRRSRVDSSGASLASHAVTGEAYGKGKHGARRTNTILSPVTRSDNSSEAKALLTASLPGGA